MDIRAQIYSEEFGITSKIMEEMFNLEKEKLLRTLKSLRENVEIIDAFLLPENSIMDDFSSLERKILAFLSKTNKSLKHYC